MKYLTTFIVLFLLMGCTHREYINHGGSINTIEQDEAQCTLEAEKSVPAINSGTNITVNTGSHLSKKERRELAEEQDMREDTARINRSARVDELRDLCLKAKGWSWKYVDNE